MNSARPPLLDALVEAGLRAAQRSDALELAKLRLLDYAGALSEGLEGTIARIFDRVIRASGGAPQARYAPTGLATSALHAAAGNAAVAHANESDDIHLDTTGYHPGVAIIPAVLAAGELSGRHGRDLLAAIVAAYELSGRIGAAITPSHRARGFHATGTVGALGAAAGAALVLGLDAGRVASAVGLATSMAAGTFAVLAGGAQGKQLHAAHAAMAGMYAASLTDAGMTGSRGALEARGGFFDAYADKVDHARLLDTAGDRLEIERIAVKPYPCCAHAFGAVELAIGLAAEISAGDIARIDIRSYRAAAVLDDKSPDGIEAAKLSLPFCVAAAFQGGGLASSDFGEARRRAILADGLPARIHLADCEKANAAFPDTRLVAMDVMLNNGERITRSSDAPPGFGGRVLPAHRVMEKFRSAASAAHGGHASAVEEAVMEFDARPDAARRLAGALALRLDTEKCFA